MNSRLILSALSAALCVASVPAFAQSHSSSRHVTETYETDSHSDSYETVAPEKNEYLPTDRGVSHTDLTACVIAKQINPQGQLFAQNRVCAPVGEEVDLFPARMMGQRPFTGGHGPSALISAKLRMNTLLSTYSTADGRDGRLFVEEAGPVKAKESINIQVRLEARKAVSLPLPSGYHLVLAIDPSKSLTTFEDALKQYSATSEPQGHKPQKRASKSYRAQEHFGRGADPLAPRSTPVATAYPAESFNDASRVSDFVSEQNSVSSLERATTNPAYIFQTSSRSNR